MLIPGIPGRQFPVRHHVGAGMKAGVQVHRAATVGASAGVAQRLEPQPSKLVVRVRFPSPAPLASLLDASHPYPEVVALNAKEKLILGAAGVLFATSTVLAVAQPGDLGDGDTDTEVAQDSTSTTVTSTTTTALPDSTSTTAATTTTTTAAGAGATTTTAGSGLGNNGAGDVRNPGDGTADTGMESMLLPGLALFGLGMAVRRVTRTHPA